MLSENAELRARSREADADSRVAELSALGLEQRPGALKLYRQVFLADDGEPAAVLLSDGNQGTEEISALEILDRFIEAMKAGDEDTILLSDQALVNNGDPKPPANADGEVLSEDERVAQVKLAIGAK